MLAADVLERLAEVLIARHLPGPAIKAPNFRERSARDVVGPGRAAVEFAGEAKQLEQPGFDLDGAAHRRAIQPADFALLAINRELIFEPIDQIERGDGQFRAVGILARVEQHFKFAGHRPAADANQIRLGLACQCGGNDHWAASAGKGGTASASASTAARPCKNALRLLFFCGGMSNPLYAA